MGSLGGMTPKGDIFVSFYSERFPLPRTIVCELSADGTLGPEIRSERLGEARNVVREVEVALHLDLDVAKGIAAWLQKKVEEAEKRKAAHAEAKKVET